jgi:hypothetical protein
MPDIIRVKAGTLDDAKLLTPDLHVWVRSAPAWFKIPEGALTYETQGGAAEMLSAVKARRANRASGA